MYAANSQWKRIERLAHFLGAGRWRLYHRSRTPIGGGAEIKKDRRAIEIWQARRFVILADPGEVWPAPAFPAMGH